MDLDTPRRDAMRIIGRLLSLLLGGLIVSFIAGAIGAVRAKRRIVPLAASEADEVRLAAIFEPLAFHSTATAFRGGDLDCWYGGGIIDLRDAVLDPAGARLRVHAVFGGGQIVVPEGWQVTTRVLGLGGIGDARPGVERAPDAPHLTIEGLALFGGFGISSEVPEAQLKGLDEAIKWSQHRRAPAGDTEPAAPSTPEPEVVSAV
jgi:hypothetical protein